MKSDVPIDAQRRRKPLAPTTPIRRPVLFVLVGVLVAACGKIAEDPATEEAELPAPAAPPADDSWVAEPLPPDPSRRPVTTPPSCAGLPGTDEELASTPRADEEAEVLALRAAGSFTADTPTYERIRRDVASIRAHVPAVRDVRGRRYTSALELWVDDPTLESMTAGTYTAWDCLHARYGWSDASLESYESAPGWNLAMGRLLGRYDVSVIKGLYKALPDIQNATSGGWTDGSSVCASREPDGTFHYVFDDASDDCPSGCMTHHQYYFVSQTDGRISATGEDGPKRSAERPPWIARYGTASRHCY